MLRTEWSAPLPLVVDLSDDPNDAVPLKNKAMTPIKIDVLLRQRGLSVRFFTAQWHNLCTNTLYSLSGRAEAGAEKLRKVVSHRDAPAGLKRGFSSCSIMLDGGDVDAYRILGQRQHNVSDSALVEPLKFWQGPNAYITICISCYTESLPWYDYQVRKAVCAGRSLRCHSPW